MTQILPDPIVNLDKDGRLVKLHCGTPGERCNLDDAEDKRTVTWVEAWEMSIWQVGGGLASARLKPGLLCVYCFGGVW